MPGVLKKFVEKYSRLPTEFDPDYLEMLRMSKYQISDVPMYKPSKCANCGSSKNDGRKYVDFGLEVDWYGTVFLCGLCLKDVAEAMGLFDNLVGELKAAYLNLQRYEDLKQEGARLHADVVNMVEQLKEYDAGMSSLSTSTDPDLSINVESNETESDKSGTDSAESKPSPTEPRVVKQTNVTGSKNVRSLTSILGDTLDI